MFKTSFLLPTVRNTYRDIIETWLDGDVEFILSYDVINPDLEPLTDAEKRNYGVRFQTWNHCVKTEGIVSIYNHMATQATGFCLAVIADDLANATPNWQSVIEQHIPSFLNEAWAFCGDDGLQSWQNNCAGHPFVNTYYYNLFDYIWNPIYTGYGCDNEFRDVGLGIGRLKYIPEFRSDNRHLGCYKNTVLDEYSGYVISTGTLGSQLYTDKQRIKSIVQSVKSRL